MGLSGIKMTDEDPKLIRNCINKKVVTELASRIAGKYPSFNQLAFIKSISPKLAALGLTERLELITTQLYVYLPSDFEKAANILINSLGPELNNEGDDPYAFEYTSNRGFVVVALTNYIARYGEEYFDLSMKAFYEMTKRFSAEFAIRYLIIRDEKKTLRVLKKWSKDKNLHVRRLVSECTRPLLPWAMRLHQFKEDPTPVLPFLETLKNDKCLYVRRSVANNLNDISKHHPKVVTKLLKDWNKDKSKETQWLIRHALRTLEKKGDSNALAILGFSKVVKLKKVAFKLKKKRITLGQSLEIDLKIETNHKTKQKLLVDYIIYHVKANGTLTPKVFKWTKKEISKTAPLELKKKHSIRKINTRKYYSGKHEIHLQINGKVMASEKFTLTIP